VATGPTTKRKPRIATPLPSGLSRPIIAGVPRRIHIPVVRVGDVPLDADEAHHARTVLRLTEGSAVEVFDDAGNVASAMLVFDGPRAAVARIDRINIAAGDATENAGLRWSVAAAVPKGERADWMVEKLSELGCTVFIPLATARSVVLPEGRNKRDRWSRIAAESAKQSRRRGVMRIEELTLLAGLLQRVADAGTALPDGPPRGWFLSTDRSAVPARAAIDAGFSNPFFLAIGPEGGWTPEEQGILSAAGLTPVGLTPTILRVETAAVAAAAIVAIFAAGASGGPG
jgi:16S rRNA (uracil1498-N3)-methyltransferase